MATIQDIIDIARVTLQDTDSTAYRYSDPEMLDAANLGIKAIKRMRPDLFFGGYATPLSDLTAAGTYPLAPEYEPALANYIVYWVSSRDEEYTSDGRAPAFYSLFKEQILA